MSRLFTTTLLTAVFAATPALAEHHGQSQDHTASSAQPEEVAEMVTAQEQDAEIGNYIDDEIEALQAFQVFLAMDDENDGRISKAEWSEWQNRDAANLQRFDEHDLDNDGDLEFSEYWDAVR